MSERPVSSVEGYSEFPKCLSYCQKSGVLLNACAHLTARSKRAKLLRLLRGPDSLRVVLLLIFSLPTPCKTATLSIRDCFRSRNETQPWRSPVPTSPSAFTYLVGEQRLFLPQREETCGLSCSESVEDVGCSFLYRFLQRLQKSYFIGKPAGLERPLLPCSVEP